MRVVDKVQSGDNHNAVVQRDVWEGALAAAQRHEKTYGFDKQYATMSQADVDMLAGKLSALRWVVGNDWDMLDL